MFSNKNYRQMLYRLLPRGPIWPSREGGMPQWDRLIRGLAKEPARLSGDLLGIVNKVIPDSATDTDLDTWERILSLPDDCTTVVQSDAERLSAIRGKLRRGLGAKIASLQEALTALDSGSVLRHLYFQTWQSGIATAGTPIYQGLWTSTAIVEYMPNLLPVDGTRFDNWTATGVTPPNLGVNSGLSPVTHELTADRVLLRSSDTSILSHSISASDNETIYFSVWAKIIGDSSTTFPSDLLDSFRLQVLKRDGTVQNRDATAVKGAWAKVSMTANLGAGGTTPEVRVRKVSATADSATLLLSDAFVGVVDSSFECRARKIFPVHNSIVFGVLDEYPDPTSMIGNTLGSRLVAWLKAARDHIVRDDLSQDVAQWYNLVAGGTEAVPDGFNAPEAFLGGDGVTFGGHPYVAFADGFGDGLSLDEAATALGSGALTIGVVVNWNDLADEGTFVHLYHSSNSSSVRFQSIPTNNDSIRFLVVSESGAVQAVIAPTILPGVDYIVVAVFDGQDVSIYVNGSLEASGEVLSPAEVISLDRADIGKRGNEELDGSIAELFITNDALSPDEVADVTAILAQDKGITV